MSTSSRVFLGSLFVLAFVMALFSMMNYLKFQGMLSGLVQGRLQATALSVAAALEGAMKGTIPLRQVPKVDTLFDQAKQADPDIERLDVFDAKGNRLFSSVKKAPKTMSAAVLTAQQADATRSWKLEMPDAFIGGARVLDPKGRPVGGVAVQTTTDAFEQQLSGFAASLVRRTGLVFLGSTVLVLLGVWIGARELRRVMTSLRAAHQRIKHQDETTEQSSDEASGKEEGQEISLGSGDVRASIDAIAKHYNDASLFLSQYEGRTRTKEELLDAATQEPQPLSANRRKTSETQVPPDTGLPAGQPEDQTPSPENRL